MEDLTGQAALWLLTLQNLAVEYGLKVIGAIAVFIIGQMIAKSIRRGMVRVFEKTEMDETLEKFLVSLVYYLILAMVILAAINIAGVPTTSFLAILGAAGLAIGLALQGTLSNVSAGVMLLIFRPFRVDDFIDAGGTTGTVEALGLFATKLNTPDNVHIVVPNASIYGGTIKNFSHNELRRNDMVMGISYDDDIALAIQTIESVLDADDRVLKDPEYQVAVSELADSSVNLVVRPWCKASDYWGLRFDLMRALKERLEAAGCSIPYPQQDVYVHKVD
jgi:small conductance mechanosensitive channel